MKNFLRIAVVVLAFVASCLPGASRLRASSAAEISVATPPLPAFPGASGYHLLRKYSLPGDGGWDYLAFDPSTRRLFISHSTKVLVVNVDTGKLVGEIDNTPGVHGIALASDLNRGFTSNGAAGTITIFDLSTLQELGTVKAGLNPDAILYDGGTKRVFAMNGRSHSATVLDATSGKVIATIPLPGRPEFAVADHAGHVFVNLEDKNEQAEIDSQGLVLISHWSIAPCESPTGLAMDIGHRRLFAGCRNVMLAVVNADTHAVISTQAIGGGVDAVRFDPATGYVFSSNGHDGSLTVIKEESPDNYTVVENVPTQVNARTMALDPRTHEIFLVTAAFTPPAPATQQDPHPAREIVPDSFVLLVFGR
ncbi:MAG TPA: YncE family protein [Verrucomicrobiae bacterium]|nr:YncE family protein [Verrucomicrobiae bacterium]